MLVIHAHVYNPAAPSLFGKGKKTEPAEYHTVTCAESARCDVFKRGQCAALAIFGACIYGSKRAERGPSQRSKGFYDWIGDRKARAATVGQLKMPATKLARIADTIWLPYAHMVAARTGVTNMRDSTASHFIPVAEFTPALIAHLCEARPQALFGGEIGDYQKESVPLFVAHLSEGYPDLLAAAAPLSARIRAIQATLTKVGRKARLHTLQPNVGTFEGYTWDGVHMRTTTRKTMPPFSPFQPVEMLIVPAADAVVVVTDDAQVTPETAWVD